jgi:hypothetical protein
MRKIILSLSILLFFFQTNVYCQLKIDFLPNEEIPREIIVSNDSLLLKIELNRNLEVSEFIYKPLNLNLLKDGVAMPLVSIDNTWSLNNVGFGIRYANVVRENGYGKITIHAYSNYLENPFHLYIELGFNNSTAITADIKVANKYVDGYSDYYRDQEKTSLIPGFPWLAFLQPDPGGKRNIILNL